MRTWIKVGGDLCDFWGIGSEIVGLIFWWFHYLPPDVPFKKRPRAQINRSIAETTKTTLEAVLLTDNSGKEIQKRHISFMA